MDPSPSAVVKALSHAKDTKSFTAQEELDLIHRFTSATHSERLFAVRVAENLRLLQVWCCEVESWSWNDIFEAFEGASDAERYGDQGGTSQERPQCTDLPGEEATRTDDFTGTISFEYERRLRQLQDELTKLAIDDQKGIVVDLNRNVCLDSAQFKVLGTIEREHTFGFDVFTSVVTDILLHSLPYYSNLIQSLDLWSCRMEVLHQLPDFQRSMHNAREAMATAWSVVGAQPTDLAGSRNTIMLKASSQGLFRSTFSALRMRLEQHIAELERLLQSMNDILEASDDIVPDILLDPLRDLESEFGDWIVHAEKKVFQYESRIEFATDGDGKGYGEENQVAKKEDNWLTHLIPGAWLDEDDVASINTKVSDLLSTYEHSSLETAIGQASDYVADHTHTVREYLSRHSSVIAHLTP